jgi:hypothetical protein
MLRLVKDGAMTEETALRWHLQANCYPPVHEDFIPAIRDAVLAAKLARQTETPAILDMPVVLPNGKVLTVGDVIERLHLEGFVGAEDDDAEG